MPDDDAEGPRRRRRRNPNAPADETHTGSSTASAGPTDRDAAEAADRRTRAAFSSPTAASIHRELHPPAPFGEDDRYRISEMEEARQISAELVGDALEWDAGEAEIAEEEAAAAEAGPLYQPLILGAPREHDTVRAQQAAQARRESVTAPGGAAPVGRFMEPAQHTDDSEAGGEFLFAGLSAPVSHQLVPVSYDQIFTRGGTEEERARNARFHTAGTPAGPVLDGRVEGLEIGWSGDPPSADDATAPLLPRIALHPQRRARRQVVDTSLHQTRLGQIDFAGGAGSTIPTYEGAIRRDREAREQRAEATKKRKEAITNLAVGLMARDPHGSDHDRFGRGPPPPPPPPAGGDPIEAS